MIIQTFAESQVKEVPRLKDEVAGSANVLALFEKEYPNQVAEIAELKSRLQFFKDMLFWVEHYRRV